MQSRSVLDNLVVPERSSVSLRYSLLETVRQYGAERLKAADGEAELERARTAHAQYYLELAERAEPMILGEDQARWLKWLDRDWYNLRSALDYLLSRLGRTEESVRMGASLAHFIWARHRPYALDVVSAALARPDPVRAEVRTKALCCVGASLAETLGWGSEAANQVAKEMMREGLEMARLLGDEAMTARVLANLSCVEEYIGHLAEALRQAEEALRIARGLGDDWLTGSTLRALALAVSDGATKRPLFTESVALLRRAGAFQNCCRCFIQLAS